MAPVTGLDIDHAGWLAGVPRQLSPNCDVRPAGVAVDLVVVHAISLPPNEFGGSGIAELFTNSLDAAAHPYYAQIHGLRVSAHLLVRRDGSLIQFVPCAMRAWHAGESQWRGRSRCNDFSIGIEVEGSDLQPFEAAQYIVLARAINAIARTYPIVHIAGHSDIAPGRKTDPGPLFDWLRLHRLLTATRG